MFLRWAIIPSKLLRRNVATVEMYYEGVSPRLESDYTRTKVEGLAHEFDFSLALLLYFHRFGKAAEYLLREIYVSALHSPPTYLNVMIQGRGWGFSDVLELRPIDFIVIWYSKMTVSVPMHLP